MPDQGDQTDQYGITWRCWDCADGVQYEPAYNPPWTLLNRRGSDSKPPQLDPIPDGCHRITHERWWELQDELQVAKDAWWAEYEATHPAAQNGSLTP